MKKVIEKSKTQKLLAMVGMILFCVLRLHAQTNKPNNYGYAPVNGIKVYYEVYGEGKPIILLHGAFYTISMNWGQLTHP